MESNQNQRGPVDASSVIVVGAGPTGLMLAGESALAGVHCRILERREKESNLTRAFGVHARTLEVLDMRGMADELHPQGLRVPEVRPHLGKVQLRLDLNHPESRFPYVLIVSQARTEKVLEARARDTVEDEINRTCRGVVGIPARGPHRWARDRGGHPGDRVAVGQASVHAPPGRRGPSGHRRDPARLRPG
jgi:2-polyprenyl-6-methoxyphenol hydroxylase-like FAD-dependent oxidoreductase